MLDPFSDKMCNRMMRKWFNANILQSLRDYTMIVEDESHLTPASAKPGLPSCTLSQFITYKRDGQELARAHQYKLRDGSIGGSGKPDPKRCVIQGKLYRAVSCN